MDKPVLTLRFFLFVLVSLISGLYADAQQPAICGSTPVMKSFCREACIICDIDGFTGRNNSNVTGQAPPGFCTSVVHHMQWIGFIAGTTNITLEVRVSSCTLNSGLEIGLYESLDCNTFRLVSECDTDIRPNTTRIFKNTLPLTIGQYYYFVMDGNGNDICDWNIKVTSGSTKVLPLVTPALINIPSKVCQDEVFEMSTPGVQGATLYNWSIDGAVFKNGMKVSHSLNKPGKYNICLDASNVCSKAPVNCTTIEVLTTPTSIVSQQVCFGECYKYHGKNYCQTGKYEVKLSANNGCDSIVTLDLIVDKKITASTVINICEGDTLTIGNGKLFSGGKHQVVVHNQEECDIYLEVNLQLIICNIQASTSVFPVNCNGENTGQIRFKVDAGTAPFTYSGFKVENPSLKYTGKLTSANLYETISGLDEGNYTFLIEDTYGNSKAINIFVPQPTRLSSAVQTSDFSKFNVSCYGLSDGFIKWIPSGGTPPYTYKHALSSVTSDSIDHLIAGTYSSTITDVNGCSFALNTILTQPDSLKADIIFTHPDCTGTGTGKVRVNSVTGGVKPYLYSFDNGSFSSKDEYTNLFSGKYSMTVKDANQCLNSKSQILVASEIPLLIIQDKSLNVKLGDSLMLDIGINLASYQIIWTPDIGISCINCLNPIILPLYDTDYQIKAVSKDGCEDSETIKVVVDKIRSFVISNIFSPNNDNSNDRVRIYSGNDVKFIDYLNIYDRWGNLVFKSENLPKGQYDLEWDGTFNHKSLSIGTYTWICRVEYIDGIIGIHSGSIQVVK